MNPQTTSPRLARAGRGEVAFIGRQDELDQLLSVYDTAIGGRSMTVLVSGEAGIGKSRLAAEFCDEARLRGAVVATGSCVPSDGGLAYAPVMGILRDLARLTTAPPRVDDLLHVLAGDSDTHTAIDTDSGDARAGAASDHRPDKAGFARTALFESVIQAVLELAEATPVVLLVEDVHWCDPSSAQLVDYLVRNLTDSRVLVLCTYRTEDISPGSASATWLAELARLPRTESLHVGPLTFPTLASMLAERNGQALDRALLQSVWARSQGNPFFAEQLAAAGADAGVPAPIQTVILARAARLSTDCRALLNSSAVAGMTVGHDLLDHVLDIGPDRLAAAVREAIDNGMLTLDGDGSEYRFRHALLREALYTSSLPAERRAAHRTLAIALEARPEIGAAAPSHRSAELAGHWWAAGDVVAALGPSVAAGESAMGAFAFTEALSHFDHALAGQLTAEERGLETHSSRLHLLERAAEAAYLGALTSRAIELGRAAVEEGIRTGDVHVAARCYVLVGRSMWGIGDSDGAFAAFDAASELLPDEPSFEKAGVLAEQARSLMLMSRLNDGRDKALEAIEVAEAAGAVAVAGHARNTLGCCISALGDPDAGIALIREAVVIAEDTLSPEDLNRGYGNLAGMLLSAGRMEEAANVVFDALAVGEDVGGVRLNSAATNSIDALMHLGRWNEAEDLQEAVGVAPYGACVASTYVDRLPFAIRRGRYADVDNHLALTHEIIDGLHDVQFCALVYALETEYELDRNNTARAVELMKLAHALCEQGDDPLIVSQYMHIGLRAAAEALHDAQRSDAGDIAAIRETADTWLASCEAAIAQWQSTGARTTNLDLGCLLIARAEHARMDRSDADAWRHAADTLDEAPSVHLAAYCRFREAEALLENRGARSRAAERLTEAWRTSTWLGADPLTKRIEALAERSRIELVSTGETVQETRHDELGLTGRETEILRYLAVGDTDRDIAERLYISKKTVSVHVSNILRKLQVSSRIEAGKIAQTHGIRA